MPTDDVRSGSPASGTAAQSDHAPSGQGRTGWGAAILHGLTLRGWSFLAAGIAATVCAFVLGQRDVLRVGVLLIALPVLGLVVLARARYRLSLHRTITPMHVPAGSTAKVRLEIEHLSRGLTRVLMAEDHIPFNLGPSPRFVISRLPGGRRAAVTYSIRTAHRGLYEIGPLRLTLADPFGLCELTRSFTATDPLTVLPRTWPLTGLPRGGHWSTSGESSHGSAAASGDQDLTVREYRYGDELRRVHWRSSARRGELMVRQDEQPRERRATVLLDARTDAHSGEGLASSFEWAVSAAASAASALVDQRYAVRLLCDNETAGWVTPRGSAGVMPLLDRLAVANMTGPNALRTEIGTMGRSQIEGVVVAVLGIVDEKSVRALAGTRRGSTGGVALLLRSWEWAGTAASLTVTEQHEKCLAMLSADGWHVASAGPQDDISTVWQRAMAGGPGGQRSRSGAPAMAAGSPGGSPRPYGPSWATSSGTTGATGAQP